MSKKEEGKKAEGESSKAKPPRKKAKQAKLPPQKPWKAAAFSFDKKSAKKDILREGEDAQRAEDVEKGLEAIYLADGSDDLGKIEHKKRRFWVKLIGGLLFILLLLSTAVWAGFYFIDPYANDIGGGLEIEIEGEAEVTLGKQETIIVHWKNRSRQPIRNVEIRLSFPAEFTPTSFAPAATNDENHIWNLGILSPDEEGSITVQGVFLGRLGDQAAIQALGTYRPSDKQEDEELVESFAMNYANTILETSFTLPPKLVSGDAFSFGYVIKNVSEDDLADMEVRYEFPANFLPSTSGTALAPLEGQSEIWTLPIELLASNTTNTMNLEGVFGAGTSGDHTFKASIGRETELGDFLAIAETETTVPVLSGDLGIQFVVNGSDADRSIQPGDNLRLAIGYENLSPELLRDVELRLRVETLLHGETAAESFVSWENLDDRTNGATSTNGSVHEILYTKEVIPAFEEMSPHQANSIDISIPTLPARNDSRDVSIRLTVEGHIRAVGEDEVNRVVQAKPIELRYRTDANLSVEARYFLEEGAPIGTGPLPPVAGETTRYRVYWVMDKNIHELEDMRVETSLPNIAAWTDRILTEAGTLSYNETERKVIWELNKVPHDIEKLEAWFEVDITPSELDIGRFAALLGESHFTATDADIGESIGTSKPPISTDLQNDEGARGKGVVRASDE